MFTLCDIMSVKLFFLQQKVVVVVVVVLWVGLGCRSDWVEEIGPKNNSAPDSKHVCR